MYTVKTRALVPFLSLPVLLLLLIYPSNSPTHLLHHLCSCNKRDSACALFHSLAFFPLLVPCSSLSPGMASPAWPFDWLVIVPRWSCHSTTLFVMCKQMALMPSSHTAPVLPSWSNPRQPMLESRHVVTLHVLSPWHLHDWWSLSITPTKQNHPSLMVKNAQPYSTQSIWTSHHTDVPLCWVMEKSVWNIMCESLGV